MYVSTNPQCGSQAVCIPLVTCLLLIKLRLTRAEMTKKQLVCAKDVHDWSCFMPWRHMYSRWRNLPIASQYSLSLFISWCFLVHLTVVQVILVPPQQYFLFSLSLFLPLLPSLWVCAGKQECKNLWHHIVIYGNRLVSFPGFALLLVFL